MKKVIALNSKERILICRLIEKAEKNEKYSKELGLTYKLMLTKEEENYDKGK